MRLMLCLLWLALPAFAQDPPRVGVIGTITALDPVQINGVTLQIAPDAPVLSPLGPRSGKTLRLGHTMAMTLEYSDSEWSVLRAVHIYPLVGPVTSVQGDEMVVMGSRVLAGAPGMFDGIGQGNWVGVSGLWQGEQLIASRAGAIPATGFAQLSGSYIASEMETENARIGGTQIVGALEEDTDTGDLWVISGTATKTALRVGLKSARPFAGEVDVVLAQGYASAPIASETFTLLGTGLIGRARESEMPDPDAPSLVCGVDGVILRVLPQDEMLADMAMRLGCF